MRPTFPFPCSLRLGSAALSWDELGVFRTVLLTLEVIIIVIIEVVRAATDGNGVFLGRFGFGWALGAVWALRALAPTATVAGFLAGFRDLGETELGALLAQHGLAAQLDAVALDSKDLHQDLIALAQLVLDFLDAVFGDFRNVEQAVGAGE